VTFDYCFPDYMSRNHVFDVRRDGCQERERICTVQRLGLCAGQRGIDSDQFDMRDISCRETRRKFVRCSSALVL
jgi:hypothetical protein